jgi:hypothetical protein
MARLQVKESTAKPIAVEMVRVFIRTPHSLKTTIMQVAYPVPDLYTTDPVDCGH